MIRDADLGLLFGIDCFENWTNLSGVVLDGVLLAIRHVSLPALNSLLVDFADELLEIGASQVESSQIKCLADEE